MQTAGVGFIEMIKAKSDGALEKWLSGTWAAHQWVPRAIHPHMRKLGPRLKEVMQEAVLDNRYTGTLDKSIKDDYDPAQLELTVGPTAKRGSYDAGVILELGTRPIPNAPWAPIKKWARRRGIDNAFPIWYAIRTRGVQAHPFVERSMQGSLGEIDRTAQAIADEMSRKVSLKTAKE